ncbi:MCE family protein [Skermania piniformis]|uniref:MCE family protein n=1 Tax=Skermania pinensis TaxID=39122 RepID=A0ABX8S8X2_9ACTN|nr:MCE family protein [Skermania piniformis]QXQ13731.1 MCE family protein [Skermania piniformis]
MARFSKPNFGAQKYFWLGMLGALVLVGLVVGASVLKAAAIGTKNVDAEFVQAAGLTSGAKVRVAGVPVGEVRDQKLEGDHVLSTLEIDKSVNLGPDAHAAIKQATVLGQIYVDLDPGDGSGLPGDRIPITNTTVPFNLGKVVNDPQYTSQFDRLEGLDTKQAAQAIDQLATQIGDSPQLTAQALDSVGVLAKVVDQRRDEVQSLLKNLSSVSNVLSDNRNGIMLIITQGEAITQRVQERQQLIKQLLDNVGTLTRQLDEIGASNDNQLGTLISDLNTMSQGLQKNNDQLNRLLQIMPVTVRQFNNVVGNGPYGDVALPWLFPDNWLCRVDVVQGCK